MAVQLLSVLLAVLLYSPAYAQVDLALPQPGERGSVAQEHLRTQDTPQDGEFLCYESTATDYHTNMLWGAFDSSFVVADGTCATSLHPNVSLFGSKVGDVATEFAAECTMGGNRFDLGASTVEFPHGAASTYDELGEGGIDTNGEQWVLYGTAIRVWDYRRDKTLVLEDPNDVDSFLFWRPEMAVTVTDIECIVDPADSSESVVIDVRECDGNGDSCSTVDATITCANTTTSDDGTFSNGAIDAGDWLLLDIGTVTGTVSTLSITVTYTIDRAS